MSAPAGFLLDTNVVSEIRKARRDATVVRFLASCDSSQISISVLTLGELWKGVAKRREYDAHGAVVLKDWVVEIERSFTDRVLGVDGETAKLWGEWSAGRTRPVVDTLIAATAVRHGLTLVTRNIADMAGLPVRTLNPWET